MNFLSLGDHIGLQKMIMADCYFPCGNCAIIVNEYKFWG